MDGINLLVHKVFMWCPIGAKLYLSSRFLYRWIKWYYHCNIPYSVNFKDVYFRHLAFDI